MNRLWHAGVRVPCPVSYADDILLFEYIGCPTCAAPHLARACLGPTDLEHAWRQLVDGLRAMVAEGFAHADQSAFNLLWWEGELVFIDFPQAVDLAANPSGLDFLHRDVGNVCRWFARRGVECDPEDVFGDLLADAFR